MELYEVEAKESERKKLQGRIECKRMGCPSQQVDQYKVVKFLTYLSIEHGVLLQIFIFMPLILMSLYIVFVEEGELVRRKNYKNS